jgi:hypothetical protein
MSYYIDIIDQVLQENLFVLEVASKSGVVLSWSGSDRKDDLGIVGSNLLFDLAHREKVDAKFIKFFTGNEIRFKAELRKQEDDTLIWSGFLIPDTYSEPYTNSVTFVQMTASCGLGRLKGKYLPEAFYRDEKSVIQIIAEILKMTALNLLIHFNPAIENSVQKDYNQIYKDTALFIDGKKKKDAYKIFEELLADMLSVCYQADGVWNIEGYNQRFVKNLNVKVYDYQGAFVGTLQKTRLSKKLKAFVEPVVTQIPPYNMISVTHKRVPQSFPATIAKEKNEGWTVSNLVKGEIYATDWNGNNGYYAKTKNPDYNVQLLKYYTPNLVPPTTTAFNENDFVDLKNKIFVYKYQKIKFKAVFGWLKFASGLTASDDTRFNNPFFYELRLNDTVLYSNKKTNPKENEYLIFEEDKAQLDFEIIMPEDGLIDLKIWRSGKDVYTTNCIGFDIKELELSPIAFEEEMIVEDLINDEFTVDKEIELTCADDETGFSDAFRLAKLKEAGAVFNEIQIPILYGFPQNGKHYAVVDLEGANLIKDNINTTYWFGELLVGIEVVYNYAESEKMVILTDNPLINQGYFTVKVYKNVDVLGSRKFWQQWTDSIYKIETNRYANTVANIIRRMYATATEKIDATFNGAVKFNDFLLFKYVSDRQYIVTNCAWNLDTNKSEVTMCQSVYRDSGNTGPNPENIPPIVNAGVDIVLDSAQSTASLLAVAYDTDGYIVSQNWTKTTGGFGDVIVTPNQLATDLQNLTEDEYEYRIDVMDNNGASAFDTVKLIRRKDYTVSLVQTAGVPPGVYLNYKYNFQITPNLDPSFNLVLKGTINLFTYNDENAYCIILKNGVQVFRYDLQSLANFESVEFTVGYMSIDVIEFELVQFGAFPPINFGSSYILLNQVEFVNGSGNILGLPVKAQPVLFNP